MKEAAYEVQVLHHEVNYESHWEKQVGGYQLG